MTNLHNITDDRSWVDLAEGEEATVSGQLEHAGTDGVTVSFKDGSRITIEADDATGLKPLEGHDVELEATRMDSGLFLTADAIADALVAFGTI